LTRLLAAQLYVVYFVLQTLRYLLLYVKHKRKLTNSLSLFMTCLRATYSKLQCAYTGEIKQVIEPFAMRHKRTFHRRL